MEIDIVWEDQVTQAIIERLLKDYRTDIAIKNRLPVRWWQIQKYTPIYNKIWDFIFLLTDLDNYVCPPSLINEWLVGDSLSPKMLFRIAQDEAESWLMSDREGFSKWLRVDIDVIPKTHFLDKKKQINELKFNYKPSLFMMKEIVPLSKDEQMKTSLLPRSWAKKWPNYNSTLIPFIQTEWNIENAMINSYSLKITVDRLMNFGK